MYIRSLAFLAGLAIATATLTACGNNTNDTEGLRIVAAFYPLQYASERIGGEHVSVTNLVKAGTEPHDLELSPRQLGQLTDADLVVYLRKFQPAVDSAVDNEAKDHALDIAADQTLLAEHEDPSSSDHNHANDPHLWLDPHRFGQIATTIADRLATLDPDNATTYRDNATEFITELDTLDNDFRAGLNTCRKRDIVVSHNAFSYLAERYSLNQIAITGLTPETEPPPARLAEIAELTRQKGISVIFFETLVSPKIAETLAHEVQVRTEVLDPLEGLVANSKEDYFSVMRNNLTTLRGALDCA